MSWFSILPPSISFIELWVARLCIVLAIITLLPWIALIFYDFILYLIRTIAYEIPVVGGRARDRPPPEAPSLSERPGGHRRVLSMPRPFQGLASTAQEAAADTVEGLKRRLVDGESSSHARRKSDPPLDDDDSDE